MKGYYNVWQFLSHKTTLIASVFIVTVTASLFYFGNPFAFGKYQEEEEGGMSKRQAMEEYYKLEFEKTVDPSVGYVPTERLITAKAQMDRQNQLRRSLRAPVGLTWAERGPNNIGGRTRSVIFDRNDGTNKKVWAAGAGGGLWSTNDITAASPTWSKINDFFDNIAITSIAQEPTTPDYMYFGTGEGWSNLGSVRGLGIWRSANRGTSWAQLPMTNTADFNYVNKIAITTDGHIYAATNEGLYKSTNHGDNWTSVVSGKCSDVEICADKSIVISTGDVFSAGSVSISNFTTHGANTGNSGNWATISPSGTYRRVELATASNSNTIYALACSQTNPAVCSNIWQSNDKGATWISRTIPTIHNQGSGGTFAGNQAWYALIAAVDPNDANTLYVAGLDICRTTDGGSNWTQISTWADYNGGTAPAPWPRGFVHADHHAITFAPGSSTTALLGNDGGVYYSTDMNTPVTTTPTMPSFAAKNTGYNVTQYYAADMVPTACSDGFIAGAQDNGTQKMTASGIGTSSTVTGGDGAFSHIDQDNSSFQISAYTYNQYYYTTDNWATQQTHTVASNIGLFINPTDFDDVNNILYTAYGAGKYGAISGGMLSGSGSTLPTFNEKTGITGAPSALKVDPNDPNVLWIASGDGTLNKVTNPNGSPMVELKPSANFFGAGSYISSIDVEKGNASHILITISNYGNAASVQESTDGGTTWTNLDNASLPDMPIRWGIFNPVNPKQILLATELGVWTTDNISAATTVWQSENTGLANVRVDMLQYRSSDYTVVAATHGRGLYTTKLTTNAPLSTAVIEQAVQTSQGYLGPNATVYFYSQGKGQLIAKIQNNSAHDYGCTTVAIGRGSSSSLTPVAFINNAAANAVMPKTVTVTPTTNNASGNYTITLYYTPAEITAWTTHTGKTWANATLVKCSGDVNAVTPAAPTAGGTITSVAQTANGSTGLGFITANVTTGFSSFATGSANSVLPIELLSFSGKNTEGGNLLTWTTANERNNKGFQVERLNSVNNWDNIGFKTANNKASTYEFVDNAPLAVSYYRLRQIDNDGTETFSKVITISTKGKSKLKVYPSIASSLITVEAAEGANYQVFNMNGQQVLNGKTGQRIDVSDLSKGTYIIRVGAEQAKFVKQ
jgi:photosystem II stability/assembly factor-like uncharacterized protein